MKKNEKGYLSGVSCDQKNDVDKNKTQKNGQYVAIGSYLLQRNKPGICHERLCVPGEQKWLLAKYKSNLFIFAF